jgi:hypothetical protein
MNRVRGAIGCALLFVSISSSLQFAGPSGASGASSLPRCSATHLHVWDFYAEGAAVDGGIIIRFRNVGAQACSLSGYASVQGINQWNGAVLTAAHTRDSYLGGWESNKPLPIVVLQSKGGVASFLVDFVGGNNIHACPYLNTLRVKVPASTTVFTLTSTKLQACKYFQVHPFVPGLSGSHFA